MGAINRKGFTMNFQITDIQQTDKNTLFELMRLGDPWAWDNNRPDIPESNWVSLMEDEGNLHGLALRADDALVGYALYFFCPDIKESRDACELRDIFVLEKFRRNGGGTKLVNAVQERARQANAGRVYWSTNAAREGTVVFYRTFELEEWTHKSFYQWLNTSEKKVA